MWWAPSRRCCWRSAMCPWFVCSASVGEVGGFIGLEVVFAGDGLQPWARLAHSVTAWSAGSILRCACGQPLRAS